MWIPIAMVDVDMNPTPLKVIRREGGLFTN